MTSTVEGDTLVYRQGEQEHILTVGTAAWFAWLENAATFSFVSPLGSFTARHERSGHQRGVTRRQPGVRVLRDLVPAAGDRRARVDAGLGVDSVADS